MEEGNPSRAMGWLERRKASLKNAPFVCMRCEKEYDYPAEKCEICKRKTIRSKTEYLDLLMKIAKDEVYLEEKNPDEAWEKLCSQYEINNEKLKHGEVIITEQEKREINNLANYQKGDTMALVGAVVRIIKNYFEFHAFEDTEEIIYYDVEAGVFKNGGEVLINKKGGEVFEKAGLIKPPSAHFLAELRAAIIHKTYIKRELFDTHPELIAVKNGVLNVLTDEFLPSRPENKLTLQLPVAYVPGADCPTFKKFLGEVVPPENVEAIWEYIGYCLYRAMPLHKILVLNGDGRNGKTTFISTLAAFLGESNFSSIEVQKLETDKFAGGYLYGKLANLCDDLPSTPLKTTGRLKTISGGGYVSCDRKFLKVFQFKNTAKLIFATNQVAAAWDASAAFYRRWLIIIFPNTFDGPAADCGLFAKLTTEGELSGILNNALAALRRLMAQGHFTNEETIDQIQERYDRLSDVVKAFIADKIEFSDGFVVKRELLQGFYDYCRENKMAAVSEKTFFDRFAKTMRVEDCRPLNIEGRQVRAWKGIRFKDADPEPQIRGLGGYEPE